MTPPALAWKLVQYSIHDCGHSWPQDCRYGEHNQPDNDGAHLVLAHKNLLGDSPRQHTRNAAPGTTLPVRQMRKCIIFAACLSRDVGYG